MWNYFYTLSYIYAVGKNRYVKFFFVVLVGDIGADYTSQSRSEFDWYYPHLYNYLSGSDSTTSSLLFLQSGLEVLF